MTRRAHQPDAAMSDAIPTIWSTDIGDPMNMRNYIHFTLRDLSKRSRGYIRFVRDHDDAFAIDAHNSVSP